MIAKGDAITDLTREQCCIVELFEIIDKITEDARNHDFSLLRARGIGACDMYQGLPFICRIRDDILDRYEDIINDAFRESERG